MFGASTSSPNNISTYSPQYDAGVDSQRPLLQVIDFALDAFIQMEQTKLEEVLRGRRYWRELEKRNASPFITSSPMKWKLNLVEGPLRMRKRLEPNIGFHQMHYKLLSSSIASSDELALRQNEQKIENERVITSPGLAKNIPSPSLRRESSAATSITLSDALSALMKAPSISDSSTILTPFESVSAQFVVEGSTDPEDVDEEVHSLSGDAKNETDNSFEQHDEGRVASLIEEEEEEEEL